MSNKNYNKMYNNPQAEVVEEVAEQEVETTVTPEVIETVAEVEPEVEIQMSIEEVAEPEVLVPVEESEESNEPITAIVVDCAKLNVREEPSPKANVVAVIDASNEVVIYEDESFGNYYKVCTASGIEGYCVKDYLKLK